MDDANRLAANELYHSDPEFRAAVDAAESREDFYAVLQAHGLPVPNNEEGGEPLSEAQLASVSGAGDCAYAMPNGQSLSYTNAC